MASLTRYWTNRPEGEATLAAAGSVCSADQADQVSSGSPTLPVRAWKVIEVPGGCISPPAHRAEPADELGVVDLGDQRPDRRELRRRAAPPTGVAGPDQEAAPGLGQQGEDLPVIELGDRRGLLARSRIS